MQTNIDFQHGKLFPMILKFSIPAAISLLITAIYNIVDRFLSGISMELLLSRPFYLFPSFLYDDGVWIDLQCRRFYFI